MQDPQILISNLGFTHSSASRPIFCGLDLHLTVGWTGVVGANGSGKTTLLSLIVGSLEPDQGRIERPSSRLHVPQGTDDPPAGLDDLVTASDPEASTLIGRLEIGADWLTRWDTLSHGERKRAQIAVALWRAPDLLAVDEPTNHIDARARRLLIGALTRHRGVGLLVSHDRELLDALCDSCLFLGSSGVELRPGGYSSGVEQREHDRESRERQYEKLDREFKRLKRETQRRAEEVSRSKSRLSKRGLARHDHDARSKIDGARLSGKDRGAGDAFKRMQRRTGRSAEQRDQFRPEKTYATGIWLPDARSRRDRVAMLPACRIPLGDDRALEVPDLEIRPDDRIALTGPNGAGKSTLISRLLEHLDLDTSKVVYLPQEVPAATSRALVTEVKSMGNARLGRLMTVLSRLGSRPDKLLESSEPSPGETRKLLLALGIEAIPHLIVMDEPTNHLDLPAIECLEEALSGCPAAMLVVSHDRPFLERLTRIEWRLEEGRLVKDLCPWSQ